MTIPIGLLKARILAGLVAVAFVLCWSSGFIGAKFGTGTAPASTLLMWRFIPFAVIMIIVSATFTRADWRRLTARDFRREVLVGLLSQCGYVGTVYFAIQLGVSSGTTALIDGTQPMVAGALAGPLLRQFVSARQWVGLCLGVTGVLVVTVADAGTAAGTAWWAYLVPFAGMLSLVAATFIERRSPTPTRPIVAMAIHGMTSAVVFTTIAVLTQTTRPPADPTFWLAVALIITLPSIGGYGLYWFILRTRGVTALNTLLFLMAPVTTIWGAIFFGEPTGIQTAIGLSLGLAAVLIVGAPLRETYSHSSLACTVAPAREPSV